LDEDDMALGLNITDGMVDDVDKILKFTDTELEKMGT